MRLFFQNMFQLKSAHTALAVKACLLGCNSATLNAQVTFVYIAVAISALAGGGATQRISHRASISLVFLHFFRRSFGVGDQDGIEIEFWVILVPLRIEFWVILVALWCNSYSGSLKEFRTRPLYRWCFRVFSTIFWGWRSRRYWDRILGHFGASVDRILGHFGGSLVQFLLGFIQRISHQAPISLVFSRFRRFFGVGDQDGTEIEFWVILVLLWTEFWVILVALWCNSYSCGAFKSGKRMKNTYWEEPHRWKKRGCYSTKKWSYVHKPRSPSQALETDAKQLRCGRPPHAKRGEYLNKTAPTQKSDRSAISSSGGRLLSPSPTSSASFLAWRTLAAHCQNVLRCCPRLGLDEIFHDFAVVNLAMTQFGVALVAITSKRCWKPKRETKQCYLIYLMGFGWFWTPTHILIMWLTHSTNTARWLLWTCAACNRNPSNAHIWATKLFLKRLVPNSARCFSPTAWGPDFLLCILVSNCFPHPLWWHRKRSKICWTPKLPELKLFMKNCHVGLKLPLHGNYCLLMCIASFSSSDMNWSYGFPQCPLCIPSNLIQVTFQLCQGIVQSTWSHRYPTVKLQKWSNMESEKNRNMLFQQDKLRAFFFRPTWNKQIPLGSAKRLFTINGCRLWNTQLWLAQAYDVGASVVWFERLHSPSNSSAQTISREPSEIAHRHLDASRPCLRFDSLASLAVSSWAFGSNMLQPRMQRVWCDVTMSWKLPQAWKGGTRRTSADCSASGQEVPLALWMLEPLALSIWKLHSRMKFIVECHFTREF